MLSFHLSPSSLLSLPLLTHEFSSPLPLFFPFLFELTSFPPLNLRISWFSLHQVNIICRLFLMISFPGKRKGKERGLDRKKGEWEKEWETERKREWERPDSYLNRSCCHFDAKTLILSLFLTHNFSQNGIGPSSAIHLTWSWCNPYFSTNIYCFITDSSQRIWERKSEK